MGCCLGTLLYDGKTSSSGQSKNTRGTNGTRGSSQVFVSKEKTEEFPNGVALPVPQPKMFTYADLKCATRNFRLDTILGEGGFGKVYKGWVDEKSMNPVKSGNGIMIAVKRLNPESMQGFEEWESEVKFLGQLQHPNLVKLLGYCVEETELLLVYEFMPRGSLEQHLFRRGPTAQEHLSWSQRLEIALGAARGLDFLHSSEEKIIYRDFKASNILLDSDYNGKLSDFGLAKYGPQAGNSHVTTRIMGTPGYAAPEYVSTGHLYVKSDVYAFGVVLLEILSGKRAMDTTRPRGQDILVEWAKPLIGNRRKFNDLMDPRLTREYPLKGAERAANLSLRCLANDPRDRPSMDEVVGILEQIKAIPEKKNKRKPISSATHKPQQRGNRTPPRCRFPRHAMGDNSGSSSPPGM